MTKSITLSHGHPSRHYWEDIPWHTMTITDGADETLFDTVVEGTKTTYTYSTSTESNSLSYDTGSGEFAITNGEDVVEGTIKMNGDALELSTTSEGNEVTVEVASGMEVKPIEKDVTEITTMPKETIEQFIGMFMPTSSEAE